MHNLAGHFGAVADAYERGRPDHPPAVAGAIAAELRVRPGDPVLDLAAGTGKLTRALLGAGLDVVAVEPQEALREVLVRNVGAERVRSGFAEAIPLPDHSVAAVTVADAFHWFDGARAIREIARVLRPAGALAVVWLTPAWSGASWAHEVGQLVAGARGAHPGYDGPTWRERIEQAGGWSAPWEFRLTVAQPTSVDRVVDHVRSMSWIAAMAEPEREELLGRVREIIQRGEGPPELTVHFEVGLARRIAAG